VVAMCPPGLRHRGAAATFAHPWRWYPPGLRHRGAAATFAHPWRWYHLNNSEEV